MCLQSGTQWHLLHSGPGRGPKYFLIGSLEIFFSALPLEDQPEEVALAALASVACLVQVVERRHIRMAPTSAWTVTAPGHATSECAPTMLMSAN